MATPRGTPKNRRTATTVGDLQFENGAFDGTCVIDIDDLTPKS
jgi:hypothetical protein